MILDFIGWFFVAFLAVFSTPLPLMIYLTGVKWFIGLDAGFSLLFAAYMAREGRAHGDDYYN